MVSTLKVDTLQTSNGSNFMINGYPQRPGQIIEHLSSPCDGSVIAGASGSYTTQAVSTYQAMSGTYTDITGSVITYTPPLGATKVVYNFDFGYCHQTQGVIGHYKFFIDATEVLYSRRTLSAEGAYPHIRQQFIWPIAIGGTTDTNTGRLGSWSTPKTLKVQGRYYTSGYYGNWHYSQYWDGGAPGMFQMPTISITAIA